MTDTRDSVIAFLTNFNKWRRGDEEIKQPDSKEIGENIDGGNRDNRRACIKAALEAAYREFLGKVDG